MADAMWQDYCAKCRIQSCIKDGKGKLCNKVERILHRSGIKSADWIRPKMPSTKREQWGEWREIPFSMLDKHNIGFDNSNELNDLG